MENSINRDAQLILEAFWHMGADKQPVRIHEMITGLADLRQRGRFHSSQLPTGKRREYAQESLQKAGYLSSDDSALPANQFQLTTTGCERVQDLTSLPSNGFGDETLIVFPIDSSTSASTSTNQTRQRKRRQQIKRRRIPETEFSATARSL